MHTAMEEIEQILRGVPDGTVIQQPTNGAGEMPPYLIRAESDGKGRIEQMMLFPGITLSRHTFLAQSVQFHHALEARVLEISFCHIGRVGWNMRGGTVVYLGGGDLCLHAMACCADSEMTLPFGYYTGITVTVDLRILEKNCPAIPRDAGFRAAEIDKKFCVGKKPVGIAGCTESDRIFLPLFEVPAHLQLAYAKLKAQELLLYLMQFEPDTETALVPYNADQITQIKEIGDFLSAHLEERFTIEMLSKRYLMNTSTLKAVFRAVYGMPIGAYVRTCRMTRAKELLRKTDDTIAAIAAQVGYETQGKFTQAFKEQEGVVPSAYRRQCRRTRMG